MAESGSTRAPKRDVRTATAKKQTAKTAPAAKTTAKRSTANKASAAAAAKKPPAPKTTVAPKKPNASKAPASKRASRLNVGRDLARSAPMSKYFSNARRRAKKMLDDPETLKKVAEQSYRSGASRSGPFTAVLDDFRTLVRLVVAYARGNYRDIPPDTLAVVVGGLIYVVSPIDLIPDGIPGLGFADDAAVIGWVIKHVHEELAQFRAWELGQESATG